MLLDLLCMFRLKSAWIIRAWQKLLRALNDSPSWRMHTAMHLHQHDSLNPGRHIYTPEHINTDSSGSKCGRCRNCFNPHRAQGCKSIGTKYEEGKSVYQFATNPDEKYTGKGLLLQAKACCSGLANTDLRERFLQAILTAKMT